MFIFVLFISFGAKSNLSEPKPVKDTERTSLYKMTSHKLANFCQKIALKSSISMKLYLNIKFVAKVNQKLQNVRAKPSLNSNLTWKPDFD